MSTNGTSSNGVGSPTSPLPHPPPPAITIKPFSYSRASSTPLPATALKKIQFALAALCVLLTFFIIVGLFAINHVRRSARKEKLIVILVSGLRADFLDFDKNLELPGFRRLQKFGSRAEFLKPVFPSSNYPNMYSSVTGLNVENHGMVADRMFNASSREFFLGAPSPAREAPGWWAGAEPIWTQAASSGREVSMYNWDGCQVTINDVNITNCEPIKELSKWRSYQRDSTKAMYEFLRKFELEQLDLGMIYLNNVEVASRKSGFDSLEVKNAIKDIDLMIYNVLNEIEHRQLSKLVNVYVYSDHGMSKPVHVIELQEHIDLNDVEFLMGKGAMSMISSTGGEAHDRILQNLSAQQVRGLKFYAKEDFPAEFHFANNSNVLDIVLKADPGYIIEAVSD